MTKVDAPDAYYEGARAQLSGLELLILDRDFGEVGRYTLDEIPEFVDGSMVAVVDGMPLVVTRDADCGCKGNSTKKVMKDGPTG